MGFIGVELFDDVIVGEYFHRRTNIQPRRLYRDLRTLDGRLAGSSAAVDILIIESRSVCARVNDSI